MSRLKEIFSNKPEVMSTVVKWTFSLPMAYITYLVVSMLLPYSVQSPNAILLVQCLRYAILILCILLYAKLFLKFDIKKFFNQNSRFNFGLFTKGFYAMALASIVTNLCYYLIFKGSIVKNPFDSSFILNWLFSLILVIVAGLAEELIFRAYIAWFAKGNLTASKKSVLVYAFISATLFTIAHFSNPELQNSAIWSMAFYFLFGFCLMLCFFKTKGIEYGLGIHVANNLFTAWLVNYSESVLPTKSLFITSAGASYITIIQAVICLAFCMFLCPENK